MENNNEKHFDPDSVLVPEPSPAIHILDYTPNPLSQLVLK